MIVEPNHYEQHHTPVTDESSEYPNLVGSVFLWTIAPCPYETSENNDSTQIMRRLGQNLPAHASPVHFHRFKAISLDTLSYTATASSNPNKNHYQNFSCEFLAMIHQEKVADTSAKSEVKGELSLPGIKDDRGSAVYL